MANLIKKIGNKVVYNGLPTEEQVKEADKLQRHLQKVIPKIDEELRQKYPNRNNKNLYAYEFGLRLNKIAKQFEVKGLELRIFLDQIRNFAIEDDNLPIDRSEERKVLEFYYRLAQFDYESVKNMNWGEWVYLFDIKDATSEHRFFEWLSNKLKKQRIKRNTLRLLMTGIKVFVKGKDLAVYTDEQIFEKYDMIFNVTINWFDNYEKYFTKINKKPTKARLKNKKKYQEKYFLKTYLLLKENNNKDNKRITEDAFIKIYYIN